MIPSDLLLYKAGDESAIPDYLGAHDYHWLQALIGEYRRFEGRARRDLDERLQSPLSTPSPRRKARVACRVLDDLVKPSRRPALSPVKARSTLFTAAARLGMPRQATESAAEELQVDPDTLMGALFADVPAERRVGLLPSISPIELALRANLATAKGLLRRANRVTVQLRGAAHAVVRAARLRGLICVASSLNRTGTEFDAELEFSGPLALFRRTLLYGRALGAVIPTLAWCERFKLRADCTIDGGSVPIAIHTGDPIFPGTPPKQFDSKLEKRFARDFAKVAPDWDLIREPQPVAAGKTLIFPDFSLVHRRDRRQSWLLEIVGFWTSDYLERKAASLRVAQLDRFIVCVDETLGCDEALLKTATRVVPFRRRIDASQVLAILESEWRR